MLEIRPNCEFCNKDLPVDSGDACICSYECTFCRDCVDNILLNVCPNCGGGFVNRPIRPKTARRNNTSIEFQPTSEIRVKTSYTRAQIIAFSETVKDIPPAE